MKNPLVKVLKDFLTTHWKDGKPILIGMSGGVDSSALFSLLVECRFFSPLDLHVAHFDHAWREESSLEASHLQAFIEGLSIPFHKERADVQVDSCSNLEDKARRLRFSFFQKIYKKVGAQALVLAHQREDQAETVLKRLFEGAGILSLGGMEPCSFYEDMVIWRPLLFVSRKDLCKWNARQSWVPFQDRTNLDPRFLRPRMRQELFPQLERCFGKNICHSLSRVSEEVSLVRSLVEKRLISYLAQGQEEALGAFLPIHQFVELDPWEKQELVRLFLRKHRMTISRSALKTVIDLLENHSIGKRVEVSRGELWTEKGSLLWWKEEVPVFQGVEPFMGKCIRLQQGDWVWEVQKNAEPLRSKDLLFSFLSGAISYRLKMGGELAFSSYDRLGKKDQEKISQYLSKNKVPSRLKRMFPYIINGNGFVCSSFCFDCDLNYNDFSAFSNIILKKSSELKDNIFPFCYASDVWE